jgi:hypothetical protein
MNISKIPASTQTFKGIKVSISIVLVIPDIGEMEFKGKA